MLPAAATEFYGLQQQVNEVAANEVARAWRRMGDDFDSSWRRHGSTILSVLVEAQKQVTQAAALYVPAVLAETDLRDRPQGDLVAGSLVGMASDGRLLDTLAYGAVTEAKTAISEGASTSSALAQGGDWLDLMTKLQVADAARQAVGVMTAARKNLGGTIRVLNPPSCQRCAILAGRFYRWSQGFQRHPKCDCVNQPVPSESYAKAEGFITDPMDAYRRGEIRDLTEAQKFALDNGADINTVVNATRGMSTTATERKLSARKIHVNEKEAAAFAASRRASLAAGHPDLIGSLAHLPRAKAHSWPTPEGIYREAAGDRDKAIAGLREWGYLT